MSEQVAALILVRSKPLCHGLQRLLKAIPRIAMVNQAHDRIAALDMAAATHYAVVLLDFDMPGNGALATATIQELKERCPETQCVVLVDSEQEQQAAIAGGADVALFKGVLATRLLAIVEGLLP